MTGLTFVHSTSIEIPIEMGHPKRVILGLIPEADGPAFAGHSLALVFCWEASNA